MPVLVVHRTGQPFAPVLWAASQAREGVRIGFLQTPEGRSPGVARRTSRLFASAGSSPGMSPPGWSTAASTRRSASRAGSAAARVLGWDARRRPRPRYPRLGEQARTRRPAASTQRTRPSRSGCRRSWPRDYRVRSAAAPSDSAITAAPCSSCSWRPCGSRSRRSRRRVGCCLARTRRRAWSRAGALEDLIAATKDRHDLAVEAVNSPGYAASGLPATTMGRALDEDLLFFAAALAAGSSLGRCGVLGADVERVDSKTVYEGPRRGHPGALAASGWQRVGPRVGRCRGRG